MQIDEDQLNKQIDLKGLTPHDLLFPVNFESVKFRAYSLVDNYNTVGTLNLAIDLERLVRGLNPGDQEDAYVYSIMTFWILRLKMFSFRKMKEQDKIRLVKENSVKAANWGLGLKEVLVDYLKTFHSRKVVEDTARNFYLAMVASEELLGGNSDGKSVAFHPTLGNWVREYQSVLQSSGEDKIGPGAFHIVKFLDTNKTVNILSGPEKQILRSLLDIYNYLLNPDLSDTFEEIPNDEANETGSYMNQQRFTVPEEVARPPAPKAPPAVPAPKTGVIKKVAMDEIMAEPEPKTASPEPTVVIKKNPSNKLDLSDAAFRPGVNLVAPGSKKPIPAATITAESLAARMERDKQLAVSSKQLARDTQGKSGVDAPSSKAESFVQKEIERKLQSLEERAKGGQK